jgi:hypothetical protein
LPLLFGDAAQPCAQIRDLAHADVLRNDTPANALFQVVVGFASSIILTISASPSEPKRLAK